MEKTMEKKNVFLVGANGRMGKIVTDLIRSSIDFDVPYIYDRDVSSNGYSCNIYDTSLNAIPKETDVIIDFSQPEVTIKVLNWAVNAKVPIVIATTGFTYHQEEVISQASTVIPIFKSSNMSYGCNVMIEIAKFAAKLLYSYDVEILDVHHSGKSDSPSGTAYMIADAIKDVQINTHTVFNRSGKRKHNEIGIASQRGGGIPGQHIITFAGLDDFIKIEHFAFDRSMFANGSLTAAKFIIQQTNPGLYTMKDLIHL